MVFGVAAFWLLQVGGNFAKVVGVSADGLTGSCTSGIAEAASSSDRWAGYLTGTCGLGRCCVISDVAWINAMFVT